MATTIRSIIASAIIAITSGCTSIPSHPPSTSTPPPKSDPTTNGFNLPPVPKGEARIECLGVGFTKESAGADCIRTMNEIDGHVEIMKIDGLKIKDGDHSIWLCRMIVDVKPTDPSSIPKTLL